MQAYCMKCRAEREMKNARSIVMKNRRPATQGICPVCGTKMFRIGKSQGQINIQMTDREKVELVLARLLDREGKVIRLRFGFDGQPLTLQETSEKLSRDAGGANIPLEQVRRIEGKALRKLRHPVRSRLLRDIKTRGDAPEYRLVRAVFGR
jgi:DNA-directed RNA polymerase specialized sigma subunit